MACCMLTTTVRYNQTCPTAMHYDCKATAVTAAVLSSIFPRPARWVLVPLWRAASVYVVHTHSPLQLGWVHAQAEGVKAVVSGQRAIQVVWELAAGEPAGAVGRGSLQEQHNHTRGNREKRGAEGQGAAC